MEPTMGNIFRHWNEWDAGRGRTGVIIACIRRRGSKAWQTVHAELRELESRTIPVSQNDKLKRK